MPFQILQSKVSTGWRFLSWLGPYQFARYFSLKLVEDRWLLGRVTEILGNRARLDGCVYYLHDPYISTELKSRFLLGTWEAETRRQIKKFLPRDLPAIEFGACTGVISCLTNKLLTNPEAHVVVEANEHMLPTLEMNRTKNGCKFTIVNAALAYGAEEVTFHLSERCNVGSSLSKRQHTATVPSITLQTLLNQEGFSRVSLICDIEKAEVRLVDVEGEVMQKHVQWFFVETHGFWESSTRNRMNLEALGFRRIDSIARNDVYLNQHLAP